MGDEVWHEVAESLGYTPKEIHGFGTCDNPTAAIIADYKHRGGMPHQFISALYKTGSPGNMTRSTCRQRTSLPSRTVMEEERSGELVKKVVNALLKSFNDEKRIIFFT